MQLEGGGRGRWPRDGFSRGGNYSTGGMTQEDWRAYQQQPWSDSDWREWDKKNGHILWMGSVKASDHQGIREDNWINFILLASFYYEFV